MVYTIVVYFPLALMVVFTRADSISCFGSCNYLFEDILHFFELSTDCCDAGYFPPFSVAMQQLQCLVSCPEHLNIHAPSWKGGCMFRLFLGFLWKRLCHRYSVLHPNAWNNGFMEMFWILQRGCTKLLVCELCFLQWLVIFNGCSVVQHMDPRVRFFNSIRWQNQLYKWCWGVYETRSTLSQPPPTMCVPNDAGYFRSGPRCWRHTWLAMYSACTLLNTGAVCGQIFMRCWKGRFFRPSWTVFSWGSVISGERDGEAAARSLQRRIGGTRCQCALNTSCVDHGTLMSTLWDLFSWRCSPRTDFCFSETFVTLCLVL